MCSGNPFHGIKLFKTNKQTNKQKTLVSTICISSILYCVILSKNVNFLNIFCSKRNFNSFWNKSVKTKVLSDQGTFTPVGAQGGPGS